MYNIFLITYLKSYFLIKFYKNKYVSPTFGTNRNYLKIKICSLNHIGDVISKIKTKNSSSLFSPTQRNDVINISCTPATWPPRSLMLVRQAVLYQISRFVTMTHFLFCKTWAELLDTYDFQITQYHHAIIRCIFCCLFN